MTRSRVSVPIMFLFAPITCTGCAVPLMGDHEPRDETISAARDPSGGAENPLASACLSLDGTVSAQVRTSIGRAQRAIPPSVGAVPGYRAVGTLCVPGV